MNTTSDSHSQSFLFLFRNAGEESHAGLSEADRARLAARWNTWVASLLSSGHLREGHPLALGGRVVSEPRGARVTDGPYAEAKEVVGGFLVVSAPHLDAAVEIARGCPGLDHGLTVEVRELLARSPMLDDVQAVSRVRDEDATRP
ncbi:YciI family protein [Opitutales bacterium ASA1]|uniref:YciI family protein n=1 Tax=Congregicoccus parvus TaxID=3081749 RepID=UPI002B283B17|nr:YciI family protein [Opitutales bacterium ASA1]